MDENWKPVVGYEGLYEVSNMGRARRMARVQYRLNRWGTQSRHFLPLQVLQTITTDRGYHCIGLWKDGKSKLARLNIIVCRAFNGPPPLLRPHALHNDGDLNNNAAANLRWGNDRLNAIDREQHGRTARGERQHSAKLTADLVRSIRARAAAGERVARMAREFGMHPTSLHAVIGRQTWGRVA